MDAGGGAFATAAGCRACSRKPTGQSVATRMRDAFAQMQASPARSLPLSSFLSHALPRARLAHLITHLPPLGMLLPRIKQPRLHVTLTGTAASSMHASTNLITQTQTSIRTAPALHAALHNYFLQVIKHCLYTVGTVPFLAVQCNRCTRWSEVSPETYQCCIRWAGGRPPRLPAAAALSSDRSHLISTAPGAGGSRPPRRCYTTLHHPPRHTTPHRTTHLSVHLPPALHQFFVFHLQIRSSLPTRPIHLYAYVMRVYGFFGFIYCTRIHR